MRFAVAVALGLALLAPQFCLAQDIAAAVSPSS